MILDQEDRTQPKSGGGQEVKVSDISEEESGDWMTKMLQSELFSRLPTANIQKLFAMLEPQEFKSGDTVINQGDAGDFYYIVQEGHCEVSRAPSRDAKPVRLAEMKPGDSFGEEALLTDATRNASVVMLTDGVLMRLSKDNFINLIKKPALNEISYDAARNKVNEGTASWLDVRFQNEHEESGIGGSLNIPLTLLRMQSSKLRKDKHYILYCDTGGRSSAAAFLLTNLGYDVSYLKNGLSSVPQEKLEKVPVRPEAVVQAPSPTGQIPSLETKAGEGGQIDLGPSIRASVIEANLAKTSMVLEEAMKKQPDQAGDEWKQFQKQLEAEKKQLEADKKEAEREARRLSEKEEEKIEKLRVDSEKRLTAEKKKLEEIYVRNTREMEKLQRMKEKAEEQIRKERQNLDREMEEAKRKLEEANSLRQQIEESRKALEEDAAKKRAEQEAMERAAQARAKAKLEENRRKLADEVARASEELEHARNEKAKADAAREAAEDEAKRIISEYKKQFDEEREREQARLQEERQRLEEESRKIQQTLKEIQMSKQEAEAARSVAQAEAQQLRIKQHQEESAEDLNIQRIIAEQIRAVETRILQAQQNLESAQKAEIKITTAKVINAQELQKSKEEEGRLQNQIASDLMEFSAEQKQQEETPEQIVAHADHLKRIKACAEAAKQKTEQATRNLFDDVAAQLGSKNKK
jgi:cAMP-binding proteins - catabolite gene activator and regulatory subunit of cAMP-dependent protein kinases